MGSVGDAFDNAVIESFWGRMQTELLNRRRWRTRVELANAMFEYLEIFHNRQRRHSSLGMLTPTEYETPTPIHRMTDSGNLSQQDRGKIKAVYGNSSWESRSPVTAPVPARRTSEAARRGVPASLPWG